MSRILRRPMFRGGRVDSRGTGITSGLMDDTGYADGGRVGFQVGGGMFSYDPYNVNNIFSGTSLGYNPMLNFSTSSKPLFSDYNPLADTSTNTMMQDRDRRIREAEERNRQSISGRTRIGLSPIKDSSIYRQEYIDTFGRTPTARDLMDYARYKDKYQESTDEVNKFLEAKKPVKTEGTEKTTGTGKVDIDLLSDEDEMKKQTELYQKLLGGDEARAQAGYDALLAAAPAFFKGRNLREAVPQVLESINKSGAFDKPRDIKQAAAQLAIQRRILMDKAGAEARAKMAELGIKKPGTLTEHYSANVRAGINEMKAAELAVRDSYGEKYKPFAFNPNTAKVGEVYKFPRDPKKPNAGFYYGEIKDLSDPKNIKINPLPL